MPSRTKAGLNLADKNSYVRVEENINDNLLKIDDDVDATWGGLYGGYIQDETITKEVGKRYIDGFNKKAYICRKPSNVNTEDAYTECNVVNNLSKLQVLEEINKSFLLGEYSIKNNLTDGETINIPLSDRITNYSFYALSVTDSGDIESAVFIFNSVTLRGIRHRFLSDSIGDVLNLTNRYYDFDAVHFNKDDNLFLKVFKVNNPGGSFDSNNKIKIFGFGKIQ